MRNGFGAMRPEAEFRGKAACHPELIACVPKDVGGRFYPVEQFGEKCRKVGGHKVHKINANGMVIESLLLTNCVCASYADLRLVF